MKNPKNWSILLLVVIVILFWANLFWFSEKDEVAFCPFASSACRSAKPVADGGKTKICFLAEEGETILSPIEGELNYGKVSFGEQPGEGLFFERLTIAPAGEEREAVLVFSGKAEKGVHYVKKGEQLGVIQGEPMTIGREKCNLVFDWQ